MEPVSTDEVTSDQGEARAQDAQPPGAENEVAKTTKVETKVADKDNVTGMK